MLLKYQPYYAQINQNYAQELTISLEHMSFPGCSIRVIDCSIDLISVKCE